MLNKKISNKGFGLIETVIGISIAVLVALAVGQVSIIALRASAEKNDKIEAINLAKEGIEIVRNIRDDGWTANISGLSFGTTYYTATSSNQWILTTTNPGLLNGKYARTVVLDNVMRDFNDDIIASGGTDDPGTKKVTVTVSWTSSGNPKSLSLEAYIANILND